MRMMGVLLLLCCFICSANGQGRQLKRHSSTKTNALFDTSRIAILPADSTENFFYKSYGPFRITKENAQVVDRLLRKSVARYNGEVARHYSSVNKILLGYYRRQYIPFINSVGERKVFINCFCYDKEDENEYSYWQQNLVSDMDGAQCFFYVTVNLNKQVYARFKTHSSIEFSESDRQVTLFDR